MAESITFINAILQGFTRGKTTGVAKFSAEFSEKVQRQMEWTDIPECMIGGKLDGELNASKIQLLPNEKELRKHGLELEVSKVHAFETIRLEQERSRGKGHRTELRFKVVFVDQNGGRKLEQYIISCGKSRLQVSYEKQPEQEELPMATPDQRQAALEIESE